MLLLRNGFILRVRGGEILRTATAVSHVRAAAVIVLLKCVYLQFFFSYVPGV